MMYNCLLLLGRIAVILGLLTFGAWMALITGGLSGAAWVVIGAVLIWSI